MLSIIIPALDEEKHLPLLLDSIKKQDFKNYEIIVADANSEDKTAEIAKRYGCKVVKGGLPAKGRNKGAKIAKGDLFLFLDADMILPSNFLTDILKKFYNKRLDIATFPLLFSGNNIDSFVSKLYNFWAKATQKVLPHAFGGTLLVKKNVHEFLKGFDEEIKLAEDHIYARKAKKIARFAYLKTKPVLTSNRRFEKDGRFKTYFRYFLAEFYTVSLGPIKSDIFKYKFNHYHKSQKSLDARRRTPRRVAVKS